MKIKRTAISSASLTQTYLPAGYTDTYQLTAEQDIPASPDDIMIDFWTDMPGWVNALLKLRNFLVQFVGLKVSKEKMLSKLETCVRTGTENGFMSVPMKNEKETVMKLTDKHLDAYISVFKENEKTVAVNTLVHFHKRLGKVYFFFVKPFHCLIVRNILKRIIKKYLKK